MVLAGLCLSLLLCPLPPFPPRNTLGALVLQDLHARDVVAQLASEGVGGQPQAFAWLSQLRTYWHAPGGSGGGAPAAAVAAAEEAEQAACGIIVRVADAAQASYGWEFLGAGNRMVATPQTDRCRSALIDAMHQQLGGALEG